MSSFDLQHLGLFNSHHRLATPVSPWEKLKIGGGTPPILTRHGWLIVYHGVREFPDAGPGEHPLCYSAGVMVLSQDHPRTIRYRSVEPVLTPRLKEERHGTVPNVVFPTGIDQTLKLARARWAEVDGDQRAAAFGYYLLLSLPPLTILLVTAGSLFVEREVATQAVVKLVNHYTPLSNEQERGAVAAIRDWLNARGKYGLIMIYRVAPSRSTTFSEVWLGALGATVLIGLGERLFLVYAANFAHFNVLYGALGGIVAFLLWLYLSSCVGVFGICYCAARAEVRGRANDPARTSQ